MEARNLEAVPPGIEWADAEIRGIRYLKAQGKRLGCDERRI
ncbi:hypothetical protein [Fodinicola feengrottensis]|uniref:Uncharacterized protein n=1 Tax=Fodinicola feengrottensis TaxID=435914 RepID=A0ABN2FRC1_9ACTN|nr:hypothetical protein [Fodinicola feengrottensis]